MPCTQITTGENNCTVCSLQFAVCGLQSAVCGLRSAVCGLRSAVCGLRSAVCGLRSAVCGLQSAVCSVQCANVIHRDLGRVVPKPINTNLRLKVNQGFHLALGKWF